MTALTSTKGRRLALIIAVVIVASGAALGYQGLGARFADSDARQLADRAYNELRSLDRSDVNRLLAEASVAAWEGRPESPLRVGNTDPDIVTEVKDGLVARYRVRRLSAERCVDAVWPGTAAFHVDVNTCKGYEPLEDS